MRKLDATTSFPRDVRLTTANAFKHVFDAPQCRSSDQYMALLAKLNGTKTARLGMVVGKKQIKLAVKRHRLKRLIRESFRHHQQLLSGLDVVVIVKQLAARENNQDVFRRLQRHWQNLADKCARL